MSRVRFTPGASLFLTFLFTMLIACLAVLANEIAGGDLFDSMAFSDSYEPEPAEPSYQIIDLRPFCIYHLQVLSDERNSDKLWSNLDIKFAKSCIGLD